MKRAIVPSILAVVALLAVVVMAGAQQLTEVPLIGFLFNLFPADHVSHIDPFRGGLSELGFITFPKRQDRGPWRGHYLARTSNR